MEVVIGMIVGGLMVACLVWLAQHGFDTPYDKERKEREEYWKKQKPD
jgi:hypothetical protein